MAVFNESFEYIKQQYIPAILRSPLNSLKALIDKKKNNIRLCKVKDNDKELLQSEP